MTDIETPEDMATRLSRVEATGPWSDHDTILFAIRAANERAATMIEREATRFWSHPDDDRACAQMRRVAAQIRGAKFCAECHLDRPPLIGGRCAECRAEAVAE